MFADVDECAAGTAVCSERSFCVDTEGSYTCECKNGHQKSGDDCVDVDECEAEVDTCSENAVCTNTDGSYTCECIEGYQGDGRTCEKTVGVCDSAPCGPHATCEPAGDSYTCLCHSGYELKEGACADIDECSAGSHNCDPHATCTNTDGSFTCACGSGYTGLGTTCEDIDECAGNAAGCDIHAVCTNTPGSFKCECRTGFEGDGMQCTEKVLLPGQVHCEAWTAWTECTEGMTHSTRSCIQLPIKKETRLCAGAEFPQCGEVTEWTACPGTDNNMSHRRWTKFGEPGCENAEEVRECPDDSASVFSSLGSLPVFSFIVFLPLVVSSVLVCLHVRPRF